MIKYNENDINYLKIIMEKAKLDKLYLKIIITYDDYDYISNFEIKISMKRVKHSVLFFFFINCHKYLIKYVSIF